MSASTEISLNCEINLPGFWVGTVNIEMNPQIYHSNDENDIRIKQTLIGTKIVEAIKRIDGQFALYLTRDQVAQALDGGLINLAEISTVPKEFDSKELQIGSGKKVETAPFPLDPKNYENVELVEDRWGEEMGYTHKVQ